MTPNELNPYVGPRPFERKKEDAARFFGRSQETEEIIALIFGHPVTLVYAQSGAGKTSLLNASVADRLEENGFEVFPLTRVGGVVPKGMALQEIKNLYIFNALLQIEADKDPHTLSSTSLYEFLEERRRAEAENGQPRPRVIIFDQFEELFTYTPGQWREQRNGFFLQVVEALEADPLLRVVFVIREDFLAELDPYARLLPERLRIRYRLERLGEKAALRAIKDPLMNTRRRFVPGVAEELVRELLIMRTVDASGRTTDIEGQYVEPVQLQVVCVTLWSTLEPDCVDIQKSHLEKFNVDDALSNFYRSTIEAAVEQTGVPEADLRNWFGKTLITSMGTRSTVFRGEESTGGIRNSVLDFLESRHIIRAEFRAGARWYELTHDRLVEPILVDNKNWFDENLSLLQRQADLWNEQDRNAALLLGGDALIEVEAWAENHPGELNKVDRDFLKVCRAKQDEIDTINREREAAHQRELEQAHRLAAAEQQRAKEQAQAASLLRTRNRLITTVTVGLVIVVCIAAGMAGVAGYAWYRTLQSENQALLSQQTAEREKKNSNVLALVAAAKGSLSTNPELSLILSREAMEMTNGEDKNSITRTEAFDALQNSLQTSRIRQTLKLSNEPYGLQYAPNGKFFVTADASGKVTLWNPATLAPFTSFDTKISNHDITISPDSRWIATPVCESKENCTTPQIKLWDVDTKNFLPVTFQEQQSESWFQTLSFNAHGTLLAAGTNRSIVYIWDTSTGEYHISPIETGENLVQVVKFNPNLYNSQTLAVTAQSGLITIWDANEGKPLQTLKGNTATVFTLEYNPDGTLLASGGLDQFVRVWDVRPDAEDTTPIAIRAHDNTIFDLAFYPDKQILLSASADGTARAWSLDLKNHSMALLFTLTGHYKPIDKLAISPDGFQILTAAWGSTLKAWDGFVAHSGKINYVRFAPKLLPGEQDFRLVTASEDGTAKVWDWNKGNPRLLFLLHSPNVSGESMTNIAIFSRDGKMIATSGTDQRVILWDAVTGTFLQQIKVHAKPDVLVFNPDSSTIAVAGESEVVKIYRVKTGQEILSLPQDGDEGHASWVFSAEYSPDGKSLVTASQDGYAIIWDVETGKVKRSFLHSAGVEAAMFHEDMLVSLDLEGNIHRWDLTKEQDPYIWPPLQLHNGIIFGTFSADGTQLVTAGYDQKVVVISPLTKNAGYQVTHTFTLPMKPKDVAFTPDGKYIVLVGPDAVLHVFPLDPELVSNMVDARVTRKLTAQECVQYFQGKCPPRLLGEEIAEDFSHDQGRWTIRSDDNGTVSIVDDHLKMEFKRVSIYLESRLSNEVYVDGAIEVDAQAADSSAGMVGILFHSVSDQFLLFGIDQQGDAFFYQRYTDQWSKLAEGSISGFQWDALNHLKVESNGNQFTFYVNGVKAIDYTSEDTSGIFAGGDVGLYAANEDVKNPNMTVIFDNFVVKPAK